MARNKIDGVIEAVRYLPDGRIDTVRLYESRGAIWSDHILLERTELVERLNKGKKFVTGQRTAGLGSSFDTGPAVRHENNIISTGSQGGTRDLLTGVPIF